MKLFSCFWLMSLFLSITISSNCQSVSYIPDTTITINDCLETTIIKFKNRERTLTRELDCFWESGVDTIIEVKNCIKSTVLIKKGRKKTITNYMDCYWDDATKTGDTILAPYMDNKWKVKIHCSYEKNGQKKSFSKGITIGKNKSYRLGLDSLERKKQYLNAQLYAKIKFLDENPDTIITNRDTTISKINVLAEINKLRESGCTCGEQNMYATTALKWSDRLTQIAFLHAKDMYERNYFNHYTPEGKSPNDRVKESGMINIDYRGENIAKGNMNGVAAVRAWKRSPGHCRNMMNAQHKHVGVARYMDKYVMLLGIDKE